MSIRHWILDENGEPVPADLMTWALWFEDLDNRLVGSDELPGGVVVSTIFLGIDCSFGPEPPPMFWETMVFCEGVALDGFDFRSVERCAGSREQAEGMHAEMLRAVSEWLERDSLS